MIQPKPLVPVTIERIKAATVVTESYVRKAIGESVDMPEAEKLIVQKWLDNGVIQYTKKKINFSKEIYFPLMQHDCFKDMTVDLWQRVLIEYLKKYNTGSSLSIASAGDYMSKCFIKYSIKPVLLKRTEASVNQKRIEEGLMKELGMIMIQRRK